MLRKKEALQLTDIKTNGRRSAVRRPYLTGVLLSLPFYAACCDAFVYSHNYGAMRHHLCKAAAMLTGVVIHLAIAAIIAGVLLCRSRSARGARVAAGIPIMLFALFLFLLSAVDGMAYPLRMHIYDGFLYENALGIRAYTMYFRIVAEDTLYDTRMFFALFAPLAVIAAAKKPRAAQLARLCGGFLSGLSVLIAASVAIGQTGYEWAVNWHRLPEQVGLGISTALSVALAICALWLIFARRRTEYES